MGNIFHEDFREFILALNKCHVEYMIVGGYSVILYGYSRTTGDLDVWVNKTSDNYKKLVNAFAEFKMPLFDMTENNFLRNRDINVFTFGRPPVSIDILTHVKGLDFIDAFNQSKQIVVEDITIQLIDFRDLIKSKKASGRSKDLDDLENLAGQ